MNSGILPGVIRGLGKARIRFDLAYKNRKIGSEYSKKFSFLEKLNLKEREFSRSALFKTLKFFSEPEPDEVLFWTVLKLINAEEVGGLCYPKEELKKFILEKNKTLEPEKSWEKYFANPSTDLLFEEEGMIYLNHLYRIEKTVCMYLEKFLDARINEKFKPFKDKKLSEEQVSIVNSIFKNSISFLSGGPGTGKTTIIQAILLSGIENGISPESIAILAPTGKAAKRLQESCQPLLTRYPDLSEPSTVHRFLGYNPSSGKYKYNAENPITKSLIVIDESSMIDIFILEALLEAYPNVNESKRIIFVGDPNQLLSVNSGSVFSDFIRLSKNTFKLTRSFRQTTEGEEIKSLANKIHSLKPEDNTIILLENISIQRNLSQNYTGVSFIETTKDEDSIQLAFDWYKNLTIENKIGQILSPYNETKIGVKSINAFIEKELSNEDSANTILPVIVNNNLYDLKLFNGENGILVSNKDSYSFTPYGKPTIQIPTSYRQYFTSAYAITVHKSQGSEYDHVCLLIPAEMENPDSLLNIRILYTAITRAKKSVTLIGSLALFQKALLNQGEERHSKIVERLNTLKR